MTPNKKNKGRYIQKVLLFRFLLFWYCELKSEIIITDHIPIFLFLVVLGKRRGIWLSYFLLWNGKTKNERTVHTPHYAFPFFLFSFCLRKKNNDKYNGSYFYFFVCGLGKRKRILNHPVPFFLSWNRKTKNERRAYTWTILLRDFKHRSLQNRIYFSWHHSRLLFVYKLNCNRFNDHEKFNHHERATIVHLRSWTPSQFKQLQESVIFVVVLLWFAMRNEPVQWMTFHISRAPENMSYSKYSMQFISTFGRNISLSR